MFRTAFDNILINLFKDIKIFDDFIDLTFFHKKINLKEDFIYKKKKILFTRRFYLQEGYADFKIISAIAELTKDKSGFFITYSVDEGEKYKFGKVTIDNKNFKELKSEDIKKFTKLIEGKN